MEQVQGPFPVRCHWDRVFGGVLQLTGLIAATVICFALSYVIFMRRKSDHGNDKYVLLVLKVRSGIGCLNGLLILFARTFGNSKTSLTFAPRNKERCSSGWRGTPGKRVYPKGYRGSESLSATVLNKMENYQVKVYKSMICRLFACTPFAFERLWKLCLCKINYR